MALADELILGAGAKHLPYLIHGGEMTRVYKKGRWQYFPPLIGQAHSLDDGEVPQPGDLRWLGDDGANVFLECQGQLVCMAIRSGPCHRKRGKRGKCNMFSQASRLRLFKKINRMDWALAGRTTFFTGTWDDYIGRPTYEQITMCRSRMHRDIEEKAGCKISGLWRVEWKLREKGRYRGTPMPHVHELLFGMPWIGKGWFKDRWTVNQKAQRNVITWVEEVKDMRMCANYLGKYLGKLPDENLSCVLDFASYLNSGRPWGTYRPPLLPLAEKVEFRVPPGALTARIRAIAKAAWNACPTCERQGFTLFGPASEHIGELIADYLLPDKPGGIGYRVPGA